MDAVPRKSSVSSILGLNPLMNMPEVTLTFKCGVISSDGHIEPDSYKFLTWSYVAGNSSTSDATFSHISLAQRILGVYPHLADEVTRIVYVDDQNDRVAIPCDNIKETLAALRVITKGQLEDQPNPIRIFIQCMPPAAPATSNCSGNLHQGLYCSDCKKGPITGFVYNCLECSPDYNMCGHCENAGHHPEHVVIRYGQDKPHYLPEMKQFLAVRHGDENQTVERTTKFKLKTCTLRLL